MPSLTGNVNNTICAEDSILVNGTVYDANNPSGTEVFTNIGPYGCDSVVTINLTVLPELTGSVTSTICPNDSVIINGNTYNANNPTGTETFTSSGPYHCDSVVTIDLMLISIDTSVTLNGNTLTANMVGGSYQWLDCNNNYGIINGETNQSYTALSSGEFAVELIQSGCMDTSACHLITISTSLDPPFKNNIRVSPSPTNGNTALDLGEKYKKVAISLLDVTGKLLSKDVFEIIQYHTISIPNPTGIYLLHIEADGNQAILKIIKN